VPEIQLDCGRVKPELEARKRKTEDSLEASTGPAHQCPARSFGLCPRSAPGTTQNFSFAGSGVGNGSVTPTCTKAGTPVLGMVTVKLLSSGKDFADKRDLT
jgi:hypothetical protein